MPSPNPSDGRSGGRILVDALVAQKVKHVFCVPGESYLAALDALQDAPGIRTVVCRQEGGAAMMAEASAKLTGQPGVCFVTRGPGATNAASGIHVAAQDSTPVVLLIGQVSRDTLRREAFQEIDYSHFYGPITKHVEQVHEASRLPEVMSRAFHTACNGRPGPVAVVLPEDMLQECVEVEDLPARQALKLSPDASDMARFTDLLAQARRPMLLAGGRNWDASARAALHEFAARWHLPVAASWRYQDVFDHSDPHYIGDVGIGINPRLAEALMQSDLVIALGIRLGEITTQGYSRLKVPMPDQQLVHIYPGAEELGRVYYPTLAITAQAPAFALALREIAPPAELPWAQETTRLHESYLEWSTPAKAPGSAQVGKGRHDALGACRLAKRGPATYRASVHLQWQTRSIPPAKLEPVLSQVPGVVRPDEFFSDALNGHTPGPKSLATRVGEHCNSYYSLNPVIQKHVAAPLA